MKITTKVRATLIAAAVIAGVGAATGGVALASTDPTPSTAAPQDTTAVLNQMDTMMQQMVQQLPADQRAAATQLHAQMRPNMQKMLTGGMSGMSGMSGMGQMNSTHPMTGQSLRRMPFAPLSVLGKDRTHEPRAHPGDR